MCNVADSLIVKGISQRKLCIILENDTIIVQKHNVKLISW